MKYFNGGSCTKDMKPKNTYLFLIPAVILTLVLATYLANIKNEKTKEDTGTEQQVVATEEQIEDNTVVNNTDENIINIDEKEKEETVTEEVETRTLVVDPSKCRGCGKCALVDPEHFKMNGGVSTVISQENLDSSKLDDAIDACRDNAITLG